jgi:hypothetical protein
MASDVSAQLKAWWEAPAPLPQLPALAAALAAAAGSEPATAAAAAANGHAQQQQQMPLRSVMLLTMVAGYMPLTVRDLEEWFAEGEVWAHAKSDTSGSTDSLRACCQQLVLTLIIEDTAATAPVMVTLLKGVTGLVPAGWGSSQQQQQQQVPGPCIAGPGGVSYPSVLLLKEAVYDAAALAAYQLHEYVEYSSWLHSNLLPEIVLPFQHQQPQQASRQQMLPLMPRAAAHVLGQWVSDLKPQDREQAYAALTGALVQRRQFGQEPDVVLQLAAVAALRLLVDDFGFESLGFCPVLGAVMEALTAMLKESDELDTQTQVGV